MNLYPAVAKVPVTEDQLCRFITDVREGRYSQALPARVSDCLLTDEQQKMVRDAFKRRRRLESLKPRRLKEKKRKNPARRKKLWVSIVQGGAPGLGKRA